MRTTIIIFLLSIFTMSVRIETAHATTCKVGGRSTGKGHYNRIQRAIDSGACTLILLYPGTYYENLTIPARSNIILSSGSTSTLINHGASLNAPIIDGSAKASIITVGIGATLVIEDIILHNGYSSVGASIYSPYSQSSIELTHVTVSNNLVETGGAIWTTGNTFMSFSLLIGNIAASSHSSIATALSVDVQRNEHVIIENNTFSNNTAINDGPAVSISTAGTATLTLNDNNFKNNTGYNCAAADLYLADHTVKSMVSNLFDTNIAEPTYGLGAVCVTATDPSSYMFIETDNFYSSNTPTDIFWH